MAALALNQGIYDRATHFQALADDLRRDGSQLVAIPDRITPERLAILQERSGLLPQAVDGLTQAVARHYNRPDLYLLLARSLYGLRAFAEAERATLTLLSQFPDCLEANVMAAALFREKGRAQESAAYLERAFACDPTGKHIASCLAAQDMLPLLTTRKGPDVPSADEAAMFAGTVAAVAPAASENGATTIAASAAAEAASSSDDVKVPDADRNIPG